MHLHRHPPSPHAFRDRVQPLVVEGLDAWVARPSRHSVDLNAVDAPARGLDAREGFCPGFDLRFGGRLAAKRKKETLDHDRPLPGHVAEVREHLSHGYLRTRRKPKVLFGPGVELAPQLVEVAESLTDSRTVEHRRIRQEAQGNLESCPIPFVPSNACRHRKLSRRRGLAVTSEGDVGDSTERKRHRVEGCLAPKLTGSGPLKQSFELEPEQRRVDHTARCLARAVHLTVRAVEIAHPVRVHVDADGETTGPPGDDGVDISVGTEVASVAAVVEDRLHAPIVTRVSAWHILWAVQENPMTDFARIREQFPITRQRFRIVGQDEPQPLIYLDHGATTHPPSPVLDAYKDFLEHSYSNVHRGRHFLSQIATDNFEHVYSDIRTFIGGSEACNTVILLSNTTQALDLAAHAMAGVPGATLVSLMEHHSNDLPHRARGKVVHFGVRADGSLDYEDLGRKLAAERVKLVAITGASNVTGYITDIHRIARMAHVHGARILVDAAQLLAHARVNVLPDDDPGHIDFLAAAGHKAYAPFGSSFLFGPRSILDEAPPYIPAGGTVVWVTPDEVVFKKSPDRHEGGTPNIAGAIALGAALRFLGDAGLDAIREHESALTEMAMDGLSRIDGVRILGDLDPSHRLGVLSMTIEEVPHELAATILNREAAIAVRNGCFCAHPYLHKLLGLEDTTELRRRLVAGDLIELPGAVRPTIGIFNNEAEIAELLRMVRVVRDRAWKGDYSDIGSAEACKEV